ncbi:MAG: polyphosphate polymerase domain-containing protein [Gemmatimonadetes bacterium]|nr:polyphosphate polymerase domain-containing protein [Gemmatimonadota bacterium]
MDARRDRYELKYPVPRDRLESLRRALQPFVVRDRHTPPDRLGYTIHSIYFDTPGFDFYHQKLAGVQHRYKVRLRGYNDGGPDDVVVLEIKRKDDRVVSKARARVLHRDLDALLVTGDVERYALAGPDDARSMEDLQRFLYRIRRHGLRPVVLIRYEREAYFGRHNDDLRITLDSCLRSRSFPEATQLFGRQTVVRARRDSVVEVKHYGASPSWLKGLLSDFGLKRGSFSKYCNCLDNLDLPHRSSRPGVIARSRRVGIESRVSERRWRPVCR